MDAPSSVLYVEGVDGQWRQGLRGRDDQPGWTPEASPGGTPIPHHQGGQTDGWGWPGTELVGKYSWVTLQTWLYWDMTVNGTLETLKHNWNVHCWHWIKGEAPTTRQVGAGGFQYVSILILSRTLWAIHFSLPVRDRFKDQIWICLAPMSMPPVLSLFFSFQYISH